MRFREEPSLTALVLIGVGGFAALLTWLCVAWFGNQPALTAFVAVVLVELFLASFGVIAMLLAERMTVSLLQAEKRPPKPIRQRPKQEPLWIRLPDPPPGSSAETLSVSEAEKPETIAFPSVDDPSSLHRRSDRAA